MAPVHGPRLDGIGQKASIGAWIVIFLLCLGVFTFSVYSIDLWFRTPYTELARIDPTTTAEDINQTIKPFQEEILKLGLTLDFYAHYFTALRIIAGLPYFIFSFLIILRRSDRLMALLFAMVLALLGSAGTWFNPLWEWIPDYFPWQPPLVNLLGALLFSGVIIFYTFPDGRFVPGWTRWLALLVVPYAAAANFAPSDSPLNPFNWPGALNFIPTVIFIGGGVFGMVYRYRRYADAVQKQQIKWFVVGSALIVVNWFVDYSVWQIYPILTNDYLIQTGRQAVLWELGQDSTWYLAEFLFAVCIAISVFRYRLWDIDLVINRVLVYVSLSALTMLGYLGAVAALGSLFQGLSAPIVFFLATGLVALLFEPLRQRVQRVVNRLMYGERDEPYQVLTRLAQRLEATIEPATTLPLTVEMIGHALKLPYVAITLKQDEGNQTIAAYGSPQNHGLPFPLTYAGQTIGELVAAARSGESGFSAADRRLLSDLARQIGVTAHAVLLSADLERARLRIVAAREEARRRLGSDLHDGVGHQLAGLARQAERARDLLDQDTTAARGMLQDLKTGLDQTIVQVRQLAHQLYPPELELLGLVGALRERLQSDADPRLTIRAELPNTVPPLPTAIESAAYYIALEALTNVSRHAGAHTCNLRLTWKGEDGGYQPSGLELEICDDGRGLALTGSSGLGLLSMQARAAEVGGVCIIEPNPGGGTRIAVRLPCQVREE
jgi:signal transduction histidine kinase